MQSGCCRRVALTAQALAALICMTIAGCTRTETYASVLREQRAALEEATNILRGVRDAESLAAAKEQLAALQQRCDAVAVKAKKLGKPSDAVREELAEETYLLQRTFAAWQGEIRRVQSLPGGSALLDEIVPNLRDNP
jgi:hypothetical protein